MTAPGTCWICGLGCNPPRRDDVILVVQHTAHLEHVLLCLEHAWLERDVELWLKLSHAAGTSPLQREQDLVVVRDAMLLYWNRRFWNPNWRVLSWAQMVFHARIYLRETVAVRRVQFSISGDEARALFDAVQQAATAEVTASFEHRSEQHDRALLAGLSERLACSLAPVPRRDS